MQNIRQNGSESPLIFTRTVIEPANNISSQPNSSAFLRLFPLMLNIFMICILCSKAQRKFSWGRFKIGGGVQSRFSTFYLNCTVLCFRS